jgi:type II secretory pathway pseudopilin PulG
MAVYLPIKNVNQQGQGLIELIVAIAVVNIGLFSVWALFLSNFAGEQEAKARIIGVNLAREGIEVVKNIRDSNWLKIESNEECDGGVCFWDTGLNNPSDDKTAIIVDLFNETQEAKLDFSANDFTDHGTRVFMIGGSEGGSSNDGFFIQTAATDGLTVLPTAYRRLLTLESIYCQDNDPQDFKCDNNEFKTLPNFSTADNLLKVGLDVKSEVHWIISGQERQLAVEDQIFNWK